MVISRTLQWVFAFSRPIFLAVSIVATSSISYAAETTNKIGITMVDIPAGSFLMGSCTVTADMQEQNKKRAFLGQAPLNANCDGYDSNASDEEAPQHRVAIRAFKMGKTEVTLGQFKKFIAGADRADLIDNEFMKYNRNGDDAPVVMVSWHDAQDFIRWLNKANSGSYRLPSESEWEYACRAGGRHTYCGSNNANEVAWYGGAVEPGQHAVAQKQANAFGLHDMSGNVREWVQDCWHDNYNGAPIDGSAWTSSCAGRGGVVHRGHTWYAERAPHIRAVARSGSSPGYRDNGQGFRVASTR